MRRKPLLDCQQRFSVFRAVAPGASNVPGACMVGCVKSGIFSLHRHHPLIADTAALSAVSDTKFCVPYLREQKHMIVAPSKAVNTGGVGVSGLEMAQNSERLVWTAEEVDAQLHKMMKNIHKVSAEAAEEYGLGYDLVAGANIVGFKKVAQAMYQQGVF